jgi:hypothetical protein
METFAKDFVTLLQYLLPGFVAAWLFYSFTSYPKPTQFERVVQALIFTLFVQALVFFVKNISLLAGSILPLFTWDSQSDLVWSIICAILLGGVFSYFANNDKIHKKLRKIGFTRESSYASEWFGAFIKNVTYIVLHLEDGRRLYGWPIEWPTDPDKGHFVLADASWLQENDPEIYLESVENIMVDAKHVKMVEFMKKTWEE